MDMGTWAWEHMGGLLDALVRDLEPLSYEHEFPPTIPCTIRQASRGWGYRGRTTSADGDSSVFRYLTRANSSTKKL